MCQSVTIYFLLFGNLVSEKHVFWCFSETRVSRSETRFRGRRKSVTEQKMFFGNQISETRFYSTEKHDFGVRLQNRPLDFGEAKHVFLEAS